VIVIVSENLAGILTTAICKSVALCDTSILLSAAYVIYAEESLLMTSHASQNPSSVKDDYLWITQTMMFILGPPGLSVSQVHRYRTIWGVQLSVYSNETMPASDESMTKSR
jgi:hypothetical protein